MTRRRGYQPWNHDLEGFSNSENMALAKLLLEIRDLLVELVRYKEAGE